MQRGIFLNLQRVDAHGQAGAGSRVYKEGDRYRSTIYNRNERIDLGFFETAEEAALAYNTKSEEIFGRTRSLNKVQAGEVPQANSVNN